MSIQSISFHGQQSGEHLVVFGAIHGNEYCGPAAIKQVIADIEAGSIEVTHGTVTFVPICNPRAYAQQKRFIDRNLNRHFYPKTQHHAYEDTLDPILCRILEDADALLDIHSYQSQGGAFAFIGTSSVREIAFARALHLPHYIYGWADAFNDAHASEEQKRASIGTTDFTRAKAKAGIAVTLECGHHHNDNNSQIGRDAILRSMVFMGNIVAEPTSNAASATHATKMHSVYYKQSEGRLAKPYAHMDEVKKGEIIAQYSNGDVIVAPEDGVIVLPKTETDHAIGAEWFYFGVKTPFPVAKHRAC
jgi:predicted deacylase